MPIDYPLLTIEDEELLAAQAIARTTGNLTTAQIDSYIIALNELKRLVENGLDAPICAELTNANPSAPHTVLLETQAWLLSNLAYRINQIPEVNFIAFANLFGIELRQAAKAETLLRFTTEGATDDVMIPAGTQVSSEDEGIVFETAEDLTIEHPATTGSVIARNMVTGHLLLSPNKLIRILDNIALIGSVTNLNAIDSGSALESVESALMRVKRYQRRGERIVSTQDLEEAILDEALNGNGIVRAFPFIENGNFTGEKKPGYTSVVVMTKNGNSIDANALAKIALLLEQVIGNQFVYIVNPVFIEFNIEVAVRLNSISSQGSIVAAIERNLRNFYAPSREQFGRSIYRSEIIALIEATSGVDRIESNGSQILTSPTTDIKLVDYQLAKLVDVTINVV